MTLDQFFRIGETVALGSHHFDAEDIKAFARRWDPQVFHVDEDLARDSVFGALCASGWHTASIWMKLNVRSIDDLEPSAWSGPGPRPTFGPSPGFQNMRWPKPVFAGETVRYTRTAIGHRRVAAQPGWRLLSIKAEAFDSTEAKVLEFESAVLVMA